RSLNDALPICCTVPAVEAENRQSTGGREGGTEIDAVNPSTGVHRVGEHVPGPLHQHPCPAWTRRAQEEGATESQPSESARTEGRTPKSRKIDTYLQVS